MCMKAPMPERVAIWPSITVRANNLDEALAYRTEAVCLLRAASQRSIDVDKEFPDLRPIPVP